MPVDSAPETTQSPKITYGRFSLLFDTHSKPDFPETLEKKIDRETSLQNYIEKGLDDLLKLKRQEALLDNPDNSQAPTHQKIYQRLGLPEALPLNTNINLDLLGQKIQQLKPRSSTTELQKRITTQANHFIRILEAHKNYHGNGRTDKNRSSTQQYLTELKQINKEQKPKLIENLLYKVFSIKTERYTAYHKLKTAIATIQEDWLKAKEQKLTALEQRIANEHELPDNSKIVDYLKAGNTADKLRTGLLGKIKKLYKVLPLLGKAAAQEKNLFDRINNLSDKTEHFRDQITVMLNDASNAEEIALFASINELSVNISQITQKIAQLTTQIQNPLILLEPEGYQSKLAKNAKKFADYTNQELQEEITYLGILIEAVKPDSLFRSFTPDSKPIPPLMLQKNVFFVDFFNEIMLMTDQKELTKLANKLTAEKEFRTTYLTKKQELQTQKIAALEIELKKVTTEKINLTDTLDKAKEQLFELQKARKPSLAVQDYQAATISNPRKNTPSNHSSFIARMDNRLSEQQACKQLIANLDNFSFGDNEPEANPGKQLTPS